MKKPVEILLQNYHRKQKSLNKNSEANEGRLEHDFDQSMVHLPSKSKQNVQFETKPTKYELFMTVKVDW